jgi:uncharacterized protein HemX
MTQEPKPTKNNKKPVTTKRSKSFVLAIVQAIIITAAIILAIGFMLGKHYAESQNHDVTVRAKQLTSSLKVTQ